MNNKQLRFNILQHLIDEKLFLCQIISVGSIDYLSLCFSNLDAKRDFWYLDGITF